MSLTKVSSTPLYKIVADHEHEIATGQVVGKIDFGTLKITFLHLYGRWATAQKETKNDA